MPASGASLPPDAVAPDIHQKDRFWCSTLDRFHQFEAIAERVVHEHAVEAFDRFVVNDPVASIADICDQSRQVIDDEGWVCLSGRAEVGVDTEMDLEVVVLEPAPPANRQMGRLGDVRQSKHRLVEGDRLVLAASGHRELHVFDTLESHSTPVDRV